MSLATPSLTPDDLTTAKKNRVHFRFGGPTKDADVVDFAQSLYTRFKAEHPPLPESTTMDQNAREVMHDRQIWSRCSQYMAGVIDRAINKARGLLTFNGLLITAGSLLKTDELTTYFSAIAIALALLSSALILTLFYVKWGAPSQYGNPKQEFLSACCVAAARSRRLTLVIVVSGLSGFMILIPILMKYIPILITWVTKYGPIIFSWVIATLS